MNASPILGRFLSESPTWLIDDMKNSDHNFSEQELNPYHIEGSVFTHTMMVFNYARIKNFPIEVLFAALFHDLGKPECIKTRTIEVDNEITHRVSFRNHEGVSFYKSIDALDYFPELTLEQKHTISKLCACHSTLFNPAHIKQKFAGESDFLCLLSMLCESDSQGRISSIPCDIDYIKQYRDFTTYPETQQNDKPCLTVLVGPPRCGKSTWGKNNRTNETIISSDNLIMETVEGATYNEKWENADMSEITDLMHTEFKLALKAKNDIIVDRTNMSKKSRRRFISVAKQNGYFIRCVVFHTGLKTLYARARIDPQKIISYAVIDRMVKSFGYPLKNETDMVICV
ncbi:MAG: AAA family ATPase [Ghiorsea sp.]